MTSTVSELGSRPTDSHRKSETQRLFEEAATASPTAREQLHEQIVVLNIDFARSLARRFRNRGVALEDLEQVALLTLVRVVPKFDITQDRDFLAYAVPSIRGDLKRYFRDHAWVVRPPRRVQEIQLEVQRAHAQAREAGTPASAEHLAAQLDLPLEDVEEALLADGCFQPLSLDTPFSADPGASTIGDTLPISDDLEIEAAEARVLLAPLLVELSSRDRLIVYLRFCEGRTQQEIADELGVTQMQVSRLLARILGRLREGLAERDIRVA